MKESRKRKSSKLILYFLWGVVILLFTGIAASIYFSIYMDEGVSNLEKEQSTVEIKTDISDKDFEKAVTMDSTDDFVTFSSYEEFSEHHFSENDNLAPRYTGRRLNIAVVGLDSRIGTNSNHADANHIVSILLDSGKIEIISVPRDTPADAGFDDTSGQNKLTVVRAARGKNAYLKELARIAQLDQIHYYVEVGFSQVIGFLEFFGYRDPKSTLQVLRSRKGLGGDDYQRTYNQAQFIRQMILKNYHRVNNGLTGELLVRGALVILNTNLTYEVVEGIISKLNMFGFPRSSNDIKIKIRPPLNFKFSVYDFTDENTINKLIEKIERFNKTHNEKDSLRINVYKILDKNLTLAENDTAKFPKRVISRLSVFYNQRSWLQIENPKEREYIRSRFENCLISAYTKLNQPLNAKKVKEEMRLEKEFFKLNNRGE